MTTPSGDPELTARVESDVHYTPRHGRDEAQFAPGTIIGGRYRVAGILGAGGMGEVYRAEDTKLGQTVALKFLPARLARDQQLLDRLHEEVRLGRLIAHPNVCRIYDIGESAGAHYVAMEYVDGEDLSRLLRRIGRLAHDKAVDIARGIAAGLAAAHAKGILHRDLKPPNVMIDAHGDARIMDFGLALGVDDHDAMMSGTPAYMAPEQLAGEPATVQTDLYSLGLVMYELFTGRRAFSARTLPERLRDLTGEITTPSSVVRDIDPAVERLILRCLAADPTQRPRSAREVVNALPGGDPLAAALAAGETPSPRTVAAAGSAGSLRPAVAWTLLAIIFVSFAVTLKYRSSLSLLALVRVQKHPEVLGDQASGILRKLAIPAQPFTSRTFKDNFPYVGWIYTTDQSPSRWERLRRGLPAVTFRYEETPAPRLKENDAPAPGTAAVEIDPTGRLVALRVVPRSDWKARPLEWDPLFAAAGLDPRNFQPATPQRVPPVPADARAAWSGRHPDDGTPIHVEAGAWRGTPVHFSIGGASDAASGNEIPFRNSRIDSFVTVVVMSMIAVALVLAWRNVRARRGDRQGALRAAAVVVVCQLVARLLRANHQPSGSHEFEVLREAAAHALLASAVVYVLYLALEPFVRRRWPDLLIGSTRLLSGNVRDPMIGRDVLIGIAGALLHIAVISGGQLLLNLRGSASPPPYGGEPDVLTAPRFIIGHIFASVSVGIFQGFLMIVILVTFMMLLRRRALAFAAVVAVMLTGFYFATGGISPGTFLIALLTVTITARYGLLAIVVTQVTFLIIFHSPQFAGGSWFAVTGLITVAIVCAAAVWAFRISLGAQNAFAATAFDE